MQSFLKDFLNTGFSKGGAIILSLLQGVVIARWLGPELNGIMAALLVYPSLFISIGSLGISQSTTFFTAKKTYTDEQIATAVIQMWILSSLLSLIACYYLIANFSDSGDNFLLVTLAIVPIPFNLFNIYTSGVFLGKNQIANFNQVNWVPPLIVFIATVILVIIYELSLLGAMIALISGPAIMTGIMMLQNKFFECFSLKLEWQVIKSMLSLGIIYAIALLAINLNYKIDIILIDNLSSSYETGIYSKGSALVQNLWQIPMLLSTIIFARSATAKDQYNFSLKVCRLLRLSFIPIIIAGILLCIFADMIITLLYGPAFRESSQVLIFLMPGVILLVIFKVLNMDLAGMGKPWISLFAMVPALIINIVLNVLWIPTYGANGAAFASTVSYAVAAFAFLWIYSKKVGIPVNQILTYNRRDFESITKLQKKLNFSRPHEN